MYGILVFITISSLFPSALAQVQSHPLSQISGPFDVNLNVSGVNITNVSYLFFGNNSIDTYLYRSGTNTLQTASAFVVPTLTLGWGNLTAFPASCPGGQAVVAIGTTLTCGQAGGGWNVSGAYLYNSTTTVLVGIGTSTPSSTLEIANTSATLNVSVGTLFVNGTTGRVGIGTYSPGNAKLNVTNGNISIAGTNVGILYPDGSFQTGVVNTSQLYGNNGTNWIGLNTTSDGTLRLSIQEGVVTNGWVLSGAYLYNNTAGANVGIGTTAPVQKLDVVGVGNFTTSVRLGANSSSAGLVNLPNNAGGLQARNAANTGDVGLIELNGINNMLLGAGGANNPANVFSNVNFGFVTDNANDIGASGANRPRNIYPGTSIVNVNGAAAAPSYTFPDTTAGLFRDAGTGRLGISTSGTERITILNGGNVGINTTSPQSLLHIVAGGSNTALNLTTATPSPGAPTLKLSNGTSQGAWLVFDPPYGAIRVQSGSGASVLYIDAGSSASVPGIIRFRPTGLTQNPMVDINGSGDILPSGDNDGQTIGDNAVRWTLVRAVTVTQGDLGFEERTDALTNESFVKGEPLLLYVKNITSDDIRTVPVKLDTALNQSSTIANLEKENQQLKSQLIDIQTRLAKLEAR